MKVFNIVCLVSAAQPVWAGPLNWAGRASRKSFTPIPNNAILPRDSGFDEPLQEGVTPEPVFETLIQTDIESPTSAAEATAAEPSSTTSCDTIVELCGVFPTTLSDQLPIEPTPTSTTPEINTPSVILPTPTSADVISTPESSIETPSDVPQAPTSAASPPPTSTPASDVTPALPTSIESPSDVPDTPTSADPPPTPTTPASEITPALPTSIETPDSSSPELAPTPTTVDAIPELSPSSTPGSSSPEIAPTPTTVDSIPGQTPSSTPASLPESPSTPLSSAVSTPESATTPLTIPGEVLPTPGSSTDVLPTPVIETPVIAPEPSPTFPVEPDMPTEPLTPQLPSSELTPQPTPISSIPEGTPSSSPVELPVTPPSSVVVPPPVTEAPAPTSEVAPVEPITSDPPVVPEPEPAPEPITTSTSIIPPDPIETSQVPTPTSTESPPSSAPEVPPSPPNTALPTTVREGFPTETATVSPEIFQQNLERARELNAEFANLTPTSGCSIGQGGCINGQLAQCNSQGTFDLFACDSGKECFAIPWETSNDVGIVCYERQEAEKILAGGDGGGEVTQPQPTSSANVPVEQPQPTSVPVPPPVEDAPPIPTITRTTVVTVDAPLPTSPPPVEQPIPDGTTPEGPPPQDPTPEQPPVEQPPPPVLTSDTPGTTITQIPNVPTDTYDPDVVPTSNVVIPVPQPVPTIADVLPPPAAEISHSAKQPDEVTTQIVDGTPTVSMYFTVTVTEMAQQETVYVTVG